MQSLSQLFDHHLLFSQHLIHHQAGALSPNLHLDNHRPEIFVSLASKTSFQINEGKVSLLSGQPFAAGSQRMFLGGFQGEKTLNLVSRKNVAVRPDSNQNSIHESEG